MSDTQSPAGPAPAEPGAAPVAAPAAASTPAVTGPIVSIAEELRGKFSLPDAAVTVQRATRLWVEVDRAGFSPLFDHLVKSQGFSILCTITGLDLGADLGLIYHLARDCDKSAGYVGDKSAGYVGDKSAGYVGDKSAGYVGDKSAGYVGGIMVNLKTRVPKGQSMKSVTPYFPGAAIYEREVEDLLGASFDGRPDMPRYPLPDDWPEGDHPLLKNWKPQGAKEGTVTAAAAAEKGATPNV